jgi:predicted nuclease with TOPRIM domain
MKNNPFIVSLLTGLIVILVVAGVSLLVKNKALSETYRETLSKNIGLEKQLEDIRMENSGLVKKAANLETEMAEFKKDCLQKLDVVSQEKARLEKLKEKLEDNLKDELMKQKLSEE